ncbi:MAG: hypothetical protein AAGA99_27850 [Actinomycetota bacterium]
MTTTEPDTEAVDVDDHHDDELEPVDPPSGVTAEVHQVTIPQATLSTDDDIDVPLYDLGEVFCFVGSSRIETNTLGRRKRDGQLVQKAKVDRDGQIAIVGRDEVEDLLASDRERRTGQLELLSLVGEYRRAGRAFASHAEDRAGISWSRDQIDGWGIRTVLGRAVSEIETVKDMKDDQGETHPLHWSAPDQIDEDALDTIERQLVEAGAWLCAAHEWMIRTRERLHAARQEAKKVAAKDGVVVTDAEEDDLRERAEAEGRGASLDGPRDADGQTAAVLAVLRSSKVKLTTKVIALEAKIPQTTARALLKELATKGAVVKSKQGTADVWALAEGSSSDASIEREEPEHAQVSDDDLDVVPADDGVPSLDEIEEWEQQ